MGSISQTKPKFLLQSHLALQQDIFSKRNFTIIYSWEHFLSTGTFGSIVAFMGGCVMTVNIQGAESAILKIMGKGLFSYMMHFLKMSHCIAI